MLQEFGLEVVFQINWLGFIGHGLDSQMGWLACSGIGKRMTARVGSAVEYSAGGLPFTTLISPSVWLVMGHLAGNLGRGF